MRKRTLVAGLAACALLAASSAFAGPMDFNFAVLPPGGSISGPPGATVGWGYELENPRPNWLVITAINADPFTNGTPSSAPFDFPILWPGAFLSVPYGGGFGLYEFTWDLGAPPGSTNSGRFVLSGEFYDGDPLQGGMLLGAANDQYGDYSVARSGAGVVPEPSTLLLLGSGIAAAVRARRRT